MPIGKYPISHLFRSFNFLTAYAPPAAASKASPPSIGFCGGADGGGGGAWANVRSGIKTKVRRIAVQRLINKSVVFIIIVFFEY